MAQRPAIKLILYSSSSCIWYPTRSCAIALKFHTALLKEAFTRIYTLMAFQIMLQPLFVVFSFTVTTLHKWFPISLEFTDYAACPNCARLYAATKGIYLGWVCGSQEKTSGASLEPRRVRDEGLYTRSQQILSIAPITCQFPGKYSTRK